MAASPTQLTLRELRKRGYTANVVERWVMGANVRQDLWGFIDVLALNGKEIVAVQATTYANMSARVKKMTDHENLPKVREAGITILIWGWRKVNNRWTFREVDMS